jgi:hypothetical protein
MIEFRPGGIDVDEWRALTDDVPGSSLLQTWEYGDAKARTSAWRAERGRIVNGDRTIGVAQALVRPLPFGLGGLVWVNRGPLAVSGGDTRERFDDLAGALHRHYAAERGLCLRIAPPLADGAVDAARIGALGFSPTATLGWASSRLDLNRPLDDVRAALNRKWRGHLNRAERSPLTLRLGDGGAEFSAFLKAHEATVTGKGFDTSVTCDFLRALQDLLPAERKMTVINAYDGDAHAGSVLLTYYGATAEYLAGNTSHEGRKLGAGQLMLWRALELCQERGIAALDLSGQDPVKTPPGILTFKEGLNAEPYRLMNDLSARGSGLLNRLVEWRVNRALG